MVEKEKKACKNILFNLNVREGLSSIFFLSRILVELIGVRSVALLPFLVELLGEALVEERIVWDRYIVRFWLRESDLLPLAGRVT